MSYESGGARKATVDQIDQLTRLGLIYQAGGGMRAAPSPPFLGSVTPDGKAAGFFSPPRQGGQVAVLSDCGMGGNRPIATVAMADETLQLYLPADLPGESSMRHLDGRYCKFNNDGTTVLRLNSAGTIVLSTDTSGNLTITAAGKVQISASGGLWVNGTQVTVP